MRFTDAVATAPWDRVYLGIIGGSVALSVGHYLMNFQRLMDAVPIHFDYVGLPDRHVPKEYFFLYPVIMSMFAAAGYSIRSDARTAIWVGDQVSVRVVMAASSVLLLICQAYAVKISRGETGRMPPGALLGAFSVMGCGCLYSLLDSVLKK